MRRIRNPFIRPPVELDSQTKQAVLERFENGIPEIDEPEQRYVEERLPRILERLKAQRGWLGDMAQVAEVLRDIGLENNSDDLDSLWCGQIATAALFYLCDPFDVIPDFNPGTGYVDDALVLNQALTEIRAISQTEAARLRVALAKHRYSSA